MKFHERQLETSLAGDSSLNRSGKKRTLSETMEDELLGGEGGDGAATGISREDDDDADDTSPRKKHNRSQPSDSDESEEVQFIACGPSSDRRTSALLLSIGRRVCGRRGSVADEQREVDRWQ